MVLIATTPEGHQAAFVVGFPLTNEELRRLTAIQSMLPGATWTGRRGSEVR